MNVNNKKAIQSMRDEIQDCIFAINLNSSPHSKPCLKTHLITTLFLSEKAKLKTSMVKRVNITEWVNEIKNKNDYLLNQNKKLRSDLAYILQIKDIIRKYGSYQEYKKSIQTMMMHKIFSKNNN